MSMIRVRRLKRLFADDVVRSGRARDVGCCNYAAYQVMHAMRIADKRNAAPYSVVQNQYSLLQRTPE